LIGSVVGELKLLAERVSDRDEPTTQVVLQKMLDPGAILDGRELTDQIVGFELVARRSQRPPGGISQSVGRPSQLLVHIGIGLPHAAHRSKAQNAAVLAIHIRSGIRCMVAVHDGTVIGTAPHR
jgi:hypothetical protein